ncbi:hypothetical protein MRB53_022899 [Persea americana]|uniref:Uncharacterized protein n=1 Tax=Persea americana TaxID=3435 RepID=A0ACC2L7S2_PERAE|nr:hypothetical protein MRB53_022899 [Persea americana]
MPLSQLLRGAHVSSESMATKVEEVNELGSVMDEKEQELDDSDEVFGGWDSLGDGNKGSIAERRAARCGLNAHKLNTAELSTVDAQQWPLKGPICLLGLGWCGRDPRPLHLKVVFFGGWDASPKFQPGTQDLKRSDFMLYFVQVGASSNRKPASKGLRFPLTRTQQCRNSKSSWPKIVVRKWLNIKSRSDEFLSDYAVREETMEERRKSCSDRDHYIFPKDLHIETLHFFKSQHMIF